MGYAIVRTGIYNHTETKNSDGELVHENGHGLQFLSSTMCVWQRSFVVFLLRAQQVIDPIFVRARIKPSRFYQSSDFVQGRQRRKCVDPVNGVCIRSFENLPVQLVELGDCASWFEMPAGLWRKDHRPQSLLYSQ